MALTDSVEEIVESSKNPLLGKHEAWGRVKLGEIAKVQNGFAFKSELFTKEKRGMPIIRIRDVGEDNTDTYYTGEYPPEYIVRSGDLLIGMDGDFNCARWRGPDALLNQRVCRIIPTSKTYEPKLLDHALPGYLKAINDVTSSVTVKHLSSRTVADIPLPLPPLPEQRRIVSAIETQLGRLDAAVARLHAAKAKLKRYKQAVLKAAYDQFEKRPLEELASVITKGASPSWQGVKYVNDTTQTLFVTSENVREGYLDLSEPKYVENSFNQLQKRSVLQNGDVLLNIVGASIGRAAIYGRDDLANTNQAVCLIRTTTELDNGFLCNYLNSEEAKTYYSRNQVDVARANLSLKDVRELPVPYVPVKEQRTFSLKIDQDLATANEMEATLDAQLLQSTRLRQAVLKRAFEGRLV